MTIIFYDIPSKLPGIAWSPNTWKTRYVLNYKRIPYKTEWIEYPDIKEFSLAHNIPPTTTFPESTGRPPIYTLPAIHDPSTGVYIADSLDIAQYLETTYPDSPRVFPEGTLGLQKAFTDAHDKLLASHLMLVVPLVAAKLNPSSEEYFRRTREKKWNVTTLEDAIPKGGEKDKAWAKAEEEFGKEDKWYLNKQADGEFVMGDIFSWADIVVASELVWMKTILGEHDEQWQNVEKWHGGRWKRALELIEEYSQIL